MATVATEFYFLLNNQSWYTDIFNIPIQLVTSGFSCIPDVRCCEHKLNAKRWLIEQPSLLDGHCSDDLIDWGVLNFLTDYRMDFHDMPRMSLNELLKVYG